MSTQDKKYSNEPDAWTRIIHPVSGWFDIDIGGIWRYRDLIFLFVRRDFVAIYKQTILGPLWYLIQPIMTAIVFTIIFGKIAHLPTDGLPPMLFYLSGIVVWRYFSDCLQKTAFTFIGNAQIFGKVYFPRLTVPVSIVVSNLISLCIQLALFVGVWSYFHGQGATVRFDATILLLPLLILQMAALGLGCGIIISSLTTKYRDLAQLIGFGVQLWMYVTPVVYPVSIVPDKWKWAMMLNPMTPIIEIFRFMSLGVGSVNGYSLAISSAVTLLTLLFGVVLFSRVERSFMDII